MVEVAADSFAALLKQHRVAAGLTQEELAERAGLSARGISDLERGVKQHPYPHTVQRLVQALGLVDQAASHFQRSARRQGVGADEGVRSTKRTYQHQPLPRQPTSFIGRQREVEEVRSLLARQDVRLLILTGPGGIGKSCLALRVAEEIQATFPAGVVFVSLASLTDPELVLLAIAARLMLNEVGGQPILDTLTNHLQGRYLLLLDNFEHLLPAAEVVSRLLAACPELRILVTSRTILHLAAEHEYPVLPLAVPIPEHLPELDALSRYDAVQLFVQRAQAAKPTFRLTDENAPVIAKICYRLDGLPLAIELAAARTRLFPPQWLLVRFSRRLQLLTGGPRDLPARQQTLRDTIDWSFRLLTPVEQRLFACLSVFAGGCAFEAAEVVCDLEGELDILEGMTSLVEKSLVQRGDGDTPRFTMLETIREYAGEKLTEGGEENRIRCAHATYFRDLVETAERELSGPSSAASVRELGREHDNVRAALEWARDSGDATMALRLAGAMWPFWSLRGFLTEGQQWLRDALGLPGADSVAPSSRVKALVGAAVLAIDQGAHDEAVMYCERSVELARRHGERVDLVSALNARGEVERQRDRYAEAAASHEEALTIARDMGDRAGEAAALVGLATTAALTGDPVRLEALGEQAAAILRELGDARGLANLQLGRTFHAMNVGTFEQVKALGEESLALFRALGDTGKQAEALWALGMGAHWNARQEQAELLLTESLVLRRERGDEQFAAASLSGLGLVAFNR